MDFKVAVKKFDDIPVMYIPKVLTMDQMDEIGTAFTEIGGYTARNGGQITGSFLLYGECTEEIMNVDCCLAVKNLLPDGGNVKGKIVEGGEFQAACAVHKGSYDGLTKTWTDLMEWIQKEGYAFDKLPSREIYMNSPENTPPEELLTEIVVPVRIASS